MLIRRLVLVVSIVFTGSLALAAAATAAGGGLSPGNYTFSSMSANAFFGGFKGGPPQPTFSVFVNHGLNSFEAENSDSSTVMESTMVQFSQFDSKGVGGFGCFIIPAGDFSVGPDMQSAALHAKLTVNNLCPGFGKPFGAGALAGATPGRTPQVEAQGGASTNLPQRESRLHAEADHILRAILIDLSRQGRPRTDDAHLALQHVDQLRQLVQAGPSQQ